MRTRATSTPTGHPQDPSPGKREEPADPASTDRNSFERAQISGLRQAPTPSGGVRGRDRPQAAASANETHASHQKCSSYRSSLVHSPRQWPLADTAAGKEVLGGKSVKAVAKEHGMTSGADIEGLERLAIAGPALLSEFAGHWSDCVTSGGFSRGPAAAAVFAGHRLPDVMLAHGIASKNGVRALENLVARRDGPAGIAVRSGQRPAVVATAHALTAHGRAVLEGHAIAEIRRRSYKHPAQAEVIDGAKVDEVCRHHGLESDRALEELEDVAINEGGAGNAVRKGQLEDDVCAAHGITTARGKASLKEYYKPSRTLAASVLATGRQLFRSKATPRANPAPRHVESREVMQEATSPATSNVLDALRPASATAVPGQADKLDAIPPRPEPAGALLDSPIPADEQEKLGEPLEPARPDALPDLPDLRGLPNIPDVGKTTEPAATDAQSGPKIAMRN